MQSTTNVFELILPITSISKVQIPIKENVQYSSLDLPFLSAIAPPPNAAIGLTYSYFYACGPEAMLKAIDAEAKTSGQLSFEERMGCGFGACMGCSCRTKYGNKRICKEGPVLEREEIIW